MEFNLPFKGLIKRPNRGIPLLSTNEYYEYVWFQAK